MEEEELRKIARDQRVIRIAARGINLALAHCLSTDQLNRLIELDEEYVARVAVVCPEMVAGTAE